MSSRRSRKGRKRREAVRERCSREDREKQGAGASRRTSTDGWRASWSETELDVVVIVVTVLYCILYIVALWLCNKVLL